MAPDLSVIVTTWNSQRWIGRCLRSLTIPHGLSCEVIVVDNGSVDQTTAIIQREAPDATLIRLGANEGPACARNLAIGRTTGRYVLTLDHDVELTPGFVGALVQAAEVGEPQVGMWTGTILRPDRTTIDSTGIVLTKTWRAFDRGSGTRQLSPREKRTAILGPSACAALYRRSMLEDIRENTGYFDERFFFLWEDVELAWRATRRGWKAQHVPAAFCYHARNGSQLSWRMRQRLSLRNRYLFLAKHRLWRPLSRYLRDCGIYEMARLSFIGCANPAALLFLRNTWWLRPSHDRRLLKLMPAPHVTES